MPLLGETGDKRVEHRAGVGVPPGMREYGKHMHGFIPLMLEQDRVSFYQADP